MKKALYMDTPPNLVGITRRRRKDRSIRMTRIMLTVPPMSTICTPLVLKVLDQVEGWHLVEVYQMMKTKQILTENDIACDAGKSTEKAARDVVEKSQGLALLSQENGAILSQGGEMKVGETLTVMGIIIFLPAQKSFLRIMVI